MKLLIPVSGSSASLAAVRFAASTLRGPDNEILLLNVQPLLPSYAARFTSKRSREEMRAERSSRALAKARAFLDDAGIRFRTICAAGQVSVVTADLARRLQVDQIVLGVKRRAGWWQALFSQGAGIIDLADVPVAVVGQGRSGAFERYGVPACVGLGLTALAIAGE